MNEELSDIQVMVDYNCNPLTINEIDFCGLDLLPYLGAGDLEKIKAEIEEMR